MIGLFLQHKSASYIIGLFVQHKSAFYMIGLFLQHWSASYMIGLFMYVEGFCGKGEVMAAKVKHSLCVVLSCSDNTK